MSFRAGNQPCLPNTQQAPPINFQVPVTAVGQPMRQQAVNFPLYLSANQNVQGPQPTVQGVPVPPQSTTNQSDVSRAKSSFAPTQNLPQSGPTTTATSMSAVHQTPNIQVSNTCAVTASAKPTNVMATFPVNSQVMGYQGSNHGVMPGHMGHVMPCQNMHQCRLGQNLTSVPHINQMTGRPYYNPTGQPGSMFDYRGHSCQSPHYGSESPFVHVHPSVYNNMPAAAAPTNNMQMPRSTPSTSE